MNSFGQAKKEKSIHTSLYLKQNAVVDQNLFDLGADVVMIVSRIRGEKSQNNLSLKTEVEKLILSGFEEKIKLAEQDIKAVGSVKEIIYQDAKQKNIEVFLKADDK